MEKLISHDAESEATSQGQYLVFVLDKELFAMNIQAIKEITEVCRLTTVPKMPDFIRGVINLRGAVVPVVDLAVRFGRQPTELRSRTCIIIIEVGCNEDEKQDVGVLVDGVSAVTEIPLADIKPPPSFGTHIRTEFISGVGKISDDFVIILNVEHILNMDQRDVLADASSLGLEGSSIANAMAA